MENITKYTELPFSQQEPLAERIGNIDQINNMTPQERVKEVVGWHLGDSYFEYWLNAAGLKIVKMSIHNNSDIETNANRNNSN